jgi:hypothetical protein
MPTSDDEQPRACIWCLVREDDTDRAADTCAITGGDHGWAEVYVI